MDKQVSEIYQKINKLNGLFSIDAYYFFVSLNQVFQYKLISILEIGVFCGKSLIGLASAFPLANKIVGVDPFFENFHNSFALKGEAEELISASGNMTPKQRLSKLHKVAKIISKIFSNNIQEKIVIHKTTQEQYLKLRKQSPEFSIIHVDGEHSYNAVKDLLDNLPSILKPGGIIIIDDILNIGFPGIAEALFRHHNYKKTLFPLVYAFNKGVFIYKSAKFFRQNILEKITEIYNSSDYNIRVLHDNSLMIYNNQFNNNKKIDTDSISIFNKFFRIIRNLFV
ncbi:MAG: class I SAM-dependent methyltransferase [Candidatus Pacebacteria bacterium]|jgi:predicted O-methyltransferase YrrM|nr:class I SAM-dependent methyltransferase [Candidatus Paceibacterota bacterium]